MPGAPGQLGVHAIVRKVVVYSFVVPEIISEHYAILSIVTKYFRCRRKNRDRRLIFRTVVPCQCPQHQASVRLQPSIRIVHDAEQEKEGGQYTRWHLHGVLTMRLSDAGLHPRQTKLIYPDHRPPSWLTEMLPRDRSSRSLGGDPRLPLE